LSCAMLVFIFLIMSLTFLITSLFPYTTLFRSNLVSFFVSNNALTWLGLLLGFLLYPIIMFFLLAQRHSGLSYIIDLSSFNKIVVNRKSTRLNSSHVKISYAVFCLKKKNKIIKE